MEHAHLILGNADAYDEAVHGGLRDCGDLTVITKDIATVAGRPCVCLTFTAELPSGELAKVQTVVTGRNFARICAAFRGRYGDNGDSVQDGVP